MTNLDNLWVEWDKDTKALLVMDDFFKFRLTNKDLLLSSRFFVSPPLKNLAHATWKAVQVIMDFKYGYRPYVQPHRTDSGASGWTACVMGRYFPGNAVIKTGVFPTEEQARSFMQDCWARAQKELDTTVYHLMSQLVYNGRSYSLR